MRDIWGFLIQTLTAAGVGALLLVLKEMFRDKLSPRWQFSVWAVLGIVMLIPVGTLGTYELVNWPLLIETVKSTVTGQYTRTMVTAPVPLLPEHAPETLWDWLFILYFAGVILCAARYVVGYLRLRHALTKSSPVTYPLENKIVETERLYSLNACQTVTVKGIGSAFVCGLFHPVLVLPEGEDIDEKVLLHELLHLKYKDVLWGTVICMFRCIHWCNPVLWYCANRAGNDLEARCDQRVLERLEGEKRRDYGRILLSMASEKYARAPGTSSLSNGGRNIRMRIESIARFKRYPKGMALVSGCITLVLLLTMVVQATQSKVYVQGKHGVDMSLASARLAPCTTPAGALDTYAKAVLTRYPEYLAMCAPADQLGEIAARMHEAARQGGGGPYQWDTGMEPLDMQEGYQVFEFRQEGPEVWKAELVFTTQAQPEQENQMRIAYRTVRTEKENGRWTVLPDSEWNVLETDKSPLLWGCRELVGTVYTAQGADFRVERYVQNTFVIDNDIMQTNILGNVSVFDSVPKPNAEFEEVRYSYWNEATYLGDPEEKRSIWSMGLSAAPWTEGEKRPELTPSAMDDAAVSDVFTSEWCSTSLEAGWEDEVHLGGGGSGGAYGEENLSRPEAFAADLYINGRKAAELTLLPEEEIK